MRALLMIVVLLTVAAGGARAAPDYARLNLAIADGQVIPAWQAFAAAADRLAIVTRAGCAAPSPKSDGRTRAAFRTAMLDWQRAKPASFGPAATNSRALRIQFWPGKHGTAARQLRRALFDRDPALLEPGGLQGRSVALQGLQAFETLITEQAGDEYACALAANIAEFVSATARDVVAGWTADDGFRTLLAPPPGGNALYADAREAATEFIKALAATLDSIIAQKLEAPLGRSAGDANPRQVENWRSGLGLANIAANLEALTAWIAVPGGFRDQLALLDAAPLGDGLVRVFREAAAQASAIPVPLSEAVADPAHRPKVEALTRKMRDLRILVRDVVAPELGVTIGFNALDGD